jgi:hypothetical protein
MSNCVPSLVSTAIPIPQPLLETLHSLVCFRSGSSDAPLRDDNETIVKERIYLVKANNNLIHNEITIVDHAPDGGQPLSSRTQGAVDRRKLQRE